MESNCKQIGSRIKERRLALNLSVDDLAFSINKNRATIYRYENGEIENLPISVLEPLAKALKTTPIYLLGWEDDDKDTVTVEFVARGGKINELQRKAIGTLLEKDYIDPDLKFFK